MKPTFPKKYLPRYPQHIAIQIDGHRRWAKKT